MQTHRGSEKPYRSTIKMGFVHDILIPVVLVVAPVLGYIPQYVEIQRTANPKAFSPLVILILLLANILRIFFWYHT